MENKDPYYCLFAKGMHLWLLDFPNKQTVMGKAF